MTHKKETAPEATGAAQENKCEPAMNTEKKAGAQHFFGYEVFK